jgi:hypothetical protein
MLSCISQKLALRIEIVSLTIPEIRGDVFGNDACKKLGKFGEE